jgi:hypothetical protein
MGIIDAPGRANWQTLRRAQAQAIPHAAYEEFAAASHGVTLLNPQSVNGRLVRFSTPPRGAPRNTEALFR